MSFSDKEISDLQIILPSLEPNLDQLRMVLKLVGTYANGDFTDERFNELKEVCKVLLNNVPFMLSLLDTTFITRVRRNEKSIFSKAAEISYQTKLEMIAQGRFNLKGEAAFYGCLPTFRDDGKPINYGNQCPLFEVCKELSNGQGVSFPLFFTLGCWKITKQLPALNLCYDKDHLVANPAINKPVSEFIANIKSEASEKVFTFNLEVWQYFSGLARSWDKYKETNNYSILTAFFHAFKEVYATSNSNECAGIIYPSAMTEAKGLNIVLSTQTVDQYLILTKVQMYLLRSRAFPYDYEPICKSVNVVDNTFSFDKEMLFWYNIAMRK